jgi:hypothetical protein
VVTTKNTAQKKKVKITKTTAAPSTTTANTMTKTRTNVTKGHGHATVLAISEEVGESLFVDGIIVRKQIMSNTTIPEWGGERRRMEAVAVSQYTLMNAYDQFDDESDLSNCSGTVNGDGIVSLWEDEGTKPSSFVSILLSASIKGKC